MLNLNWPGLWWRVLFSPFSPRYLTLNVPINNLQTLLKCRFSFSRFEVWVSSSFSRELRICISSKLPDDTDAIWEPLMQVHFRMSASVMTLWACVVSSVITFMLNIFEMCQLLTHRCCKAQCAISRWTDLLGEAASCCWAPRKSQLMQYVSSANCDFTSHQDLQDSLLTSYPYWFLS